MQLVALSPRPSPGDDAPQFERLIANLSSRFATLQPGDLAHVLPTALEQICLTLGVDREQRHRAERQRGHPRPLHAQLAGSAEQRRGVPTSERCRWLIAQLQANQTVVVRDSRICRSRRRPSASTARQAGLQRAPRDADVDWRLPAGRADALERRSGCASGARRCRIGRACWPRSSAPRCSAAARMPRCTPASPRSSG